MLVELPTLSSLWCHGPLNVVVSEINLVCHNTAVWNARTKFQDLPLLRAKCVSLEFSYNRANKSRLRPHLQIRSPQHYPAYPIGIHFRFKNLCQGRDHMEWAYS